jgi:patatin-like phospholipase/acyl hydrolase
MQVRRILSLDGGGIRGLVTCRWLAGVDAALAAAGRREIPASFDLLAGSSTGGLIACGLALGRPPTELAELYRARRDEIFPGIARRLWSRTTRLFSQGPSAPRYDGRGLEGVLADTFGDARLGDLRTPTLVTSYDTISRKPVIFKSFKPEHADLRVRDVCRATSAAPTYFPAHPMRVEGADCALIDGGIVANNPTACAIAEALRRDDRVHCPEDLVVLSVGSGERIRPIDLRAAREWGALEWAVPIIDVLFDGNAESVDYIARHVVGDAYFRMQAPLTVGLDDLDDVSETNVQALEALAQGYLREPSTQAMLAALAARL